MMCTYARACRNSSARNLPPSIRSTRIMYVRIYAYIPIFRPCNILLPLSLPRSRAFPLRAHAGTPSNRFSACRSRRCSCRSLVRKVSVPIIDHIAITNSVGSPQEFQTEHERALAVYSTALAFFYNVTWPDNPLYLYVYAHLTNRRVTPNYTAAIN